MEGQPNSNKIKTKFNMGAVNIENILINLKKVEKTHEVVDGMKRPVYEGKVGGLTVRLDVKNGRIDGWKIMDASEKEQVKNAFGGNHGLNSEIEAKLLALTGVSSLALTPKGI
ncbi:MAG: hypothetical protein KAI16_01480 [Candidatus Pacebacteria bacterium]|nr:hypothetical protein [Candidatus Paceibacterota bacterium]